MDRWVHQSSSARKEVDTTRSPPQPQSPVRALMQITPSSFAQLPANDLAELGPTERRQQPSHGPQPKRIQAFRTSEGVGFGRASETTGTEADFPSPESTTSRKETTWRQREFELADLQRRVEELRRAGESAPSRAPAVGRRHASTPSPHRQGDVAARLRQSLEQLGQYPLSAQERTGSMRPPPSMPGKASDPFLLRQTSSSSGSELWERNFRSSEAQDLPANVRKGERLRRPYTSVEALVEALYERRLELMVDESVTSQLTGAQVIRVLTSNDDQGIRDIVEQAEDTRNPLLSKALFDFISSRPAMHRCLKDSPAHSDVSHPKDSSASSAPSPQHEVSTEIYNNPLPGISAPPTYDEAIRSPGSASAPEDDSSDSDADDLDPCSRLDCLFDVIHERFPQALDIECDDATLRQIIQASTESFPDFEGLKNILRRRPELYRAVWLNRESLRLIFVPPSSASEPKPTPTISTSSKHRHKRSGLEPSSTSHGTDTDGSSPDSDWNDSKPSSRLDCLVGLVHETFPQALEIECDDVTLENIIDASGETFVDFEELTDLLRRRSDLYNISWIDKDSLRVIFRHAVDQQKGISHQSAEMVGRAPSVRPPLSLDTGQALYGPTQSRPGPSQLVTLSSASPLSATNPVRMAHDYRWLRPQPTQVYDNLDAWFPHHDLNRPIHVDLVPPNVQLSGPLSASGGYPAPFAPATATTSPPTQATKLGGRTQSIRAIAQESKSRLLKVERPAEREKGEPAMSPTEGEARREGDGAEFRLGAKLGRSGAVVRRRSAKMWGAKIEEVRPRDEVDAWSPAPRSGHPDSDERVKFKWVKGERIGKGSHVDVYLALNVTSGDMLAVKEVRRVETSATGDDGRINASQALIREVGLMRDLEHPNIVQYLGYEESRDYRRVFLEYVPGGSIGQCLRRQGPLEYSVMKLFVLQALEGLKYLHSREVVNGCLKSDTLLVDLSGVVKISCTSFAGRSDDAWSGATIFKEDSVFWTAPETIYWSGKTESTSKRDIWSVGCIVVEMLTAKRPWPDEDAIQAGFKIGAERARPPLPSGLELPFRCPHFLDQCFTADPAHRPTAARLLEHRFLELEPEWNFEDSKLYSLLRSRP